MTSLYEVLKAQKMGAAIAPDYFTALWAGATGGGEQWEVIEYTGAVPVTIYAAGEPLIEMIISGNMSQSGTPSPTTTIQPSETGERTGNLLNPATIESGYNIDSSGNLVPQATRTATTTPVDVTDIDDIVLSYSSSSGGNINFIYALYAGSTLVYRKANNFSGDTIDVSGGDRVYFCWYRTGTITKSDIIKPIVNSGSAPLSYEPYGYKIPISSANTTTPVYLGEVETERKIRKLVLTGGETDWSNTYGESLFRLPILNTGGLIGGISSHFSFNPIQSGLNAGLASGEFATQILRLQIVLFFKNTAYTSVSMWKTYLQQQYAAGTPVCVWYVLATPTTGILNEPLRKIGTYADSLSVSQTIPTVEGENLIDVETTLKPSEIYLKYKGRSNS